MGKWKKLRRRISAHESQSKLLTSYDDLALADDGPVVISRKKFWSFPLRFRKNKKRNCIGIYNVDRMSKDNLSFQESITSIDSGYLIVNGSTSIENTLNSDLEETFPKLFHQTDLNNTPKDSNDSKAIDELRAQLEMKDAVILNLNTENMALNERSAVLETQNADLKDEILLMKRREETAMNELLLENTVLLDRIYSLEERLKTIVACKSKQIRQINQLKAEKRKLKKDQKENKAPVVIVKAAKGLYIGCRQKEVKVTVERSSSYKSKKSRYSCTTSSISSSSLSFGSRQWFTPQDELEVPVNRATSIEQWTLAASQTQADVSTSVVRSIANIETESVECGRENEADDTKRASEWEKLLQFDEENNVEALLPTTIAEVLETPVSSLASVGPAVLPQGTARIPSIGHIWEALMGTYNILQQRQRLLAWSELTQEFREFITFVQKFCGDNLPRLVSLLGASGLPPADTAANTISRAVQLWILETSRGQEVSPASWPWRLHQILASM